MNPPPDPDSTPTYLETRMAAFYASRYYWPAALLLFALACALGYRATH